MPIPVSRMDRRATFLARASAARDDYGAAKETWTTGDTVWAHLSKPRETTRTEHGRYASPTDALLTVYAHTQCVAGNRVLVGGVTYEIQGVDATACDIYHADLAEVV